MIAHSQISQQMCRYILHEQRVTEEPCWKSYWKGITIIKSVLHQGMCDCCKIKYRSTARLRPKKHTTIVLIFQRLFNERTGVVCRSWDWAQQSVSIWFFCTYHLIIGSIHLCFLSPDGLFPWLCCPLDLDFQSWVFNHKIESQEFRNYFLQSTL